MWNHPTKWIGSASPDKRFRISQSLRWVWQRSLSLGRFSQKCAGISQQPSHIPHSRELPFPGVAKPSGYPAINDFCSSDFCFIISGFCSPFPPPLKNKNKKTHCYVSNDIQLPETTIPLAKATRNLKPRLAACWDKKRLSQPVFLWQTYNYLSPKYFPGFFPLSARPARPLF